MTGLPNTQVLLPTLAYVVTTLVTLTVPADAGAQKNCQYGSRQYYPGVVDLEPCVNCLCDGVTGEFRCSYKECPPMDDPTCINYEVAPGACCATCLEHGCHFQGRGYPRGARIPAGPCHYCYCPWQGEPKGDPVCVEIACRNVTCTTAVNTAADGVTAEVEAVRAYVPPGKCCPVCPPIHSEQALRNGS